MKMVNGEMQTDEYLPDGPVRTPPTETDRRKMVDKEGNPQKAPERPAFAPAVSDGPLAAIEKRLAEWEQLYKAIEQRLVIQSKVGEKAADLFEVQATQIASLQQAVSAIERRQMPLVRGSTDVIPFDDECDACTGTIYPESDRISLCRTHYELATRTKA